MKDEIKPQPPITPEPDFDDDDDDDDVSFYTREDYERFPVLGELLSQIKANDEAECDNQ